MKIGIVTTWFERGAAYVSKQYISTLEKKHEIFIYARGGEKQAQNEDNWSRYNVTWGDRKWDKGGSKDRKKENLEHFKNWIKDNRLDVVFFNEEHVWKAVVLCNEMNVKTGAYVDYYTKETVPLFGVYDFLICNTKRHQSVFTWHPQSYFIPWGTDVEIFKPRNYDLVEPHIVTFFHSAGMNPKRKGTDILIRVFDTLSAKHENIKLVIHTQVPLKRFFPELWITAGRLVKQGKLIYKEETVPAPGLYHLGDVYVYPTTLEGIGLTLVEALASGLPVITSDNGPMNEFINEKNGRLVKIKKCYQRYFDHYYWPLCEIDEENLVQSMEYYIQNKGKIKELKKSARASAENRMDWRKNENAIFMAIENSRIIKDKAIALKKIARLEWTKSNRILWILHRVGILKFDSIFVFWDLIKRKIKKAV